VEENEAGSALFGLKKTFSCVISGNMLRSEGLSCGSVVDPLLSMLEAFRFQPQHYKVRKGRLDQEEV
jgi:hypothetical protein